MANREWPDGECPQEKLLTRGAGALSDAELLALFIRSGTGGLSALDIGRELITEFGGIRQVLTADRDKLLRARGLGPARCAL